MDFINEQDRRDALAAYETETAPTLMQLAGAVFRQETVPGSMLSRERTQYAIKGMTEAVDMDYIRALPERYQPYAKSFVGLTEQGAEAQMRNLDQQFHDEEIRAASSGLADFALSIAVQPFDPINYIPLGGTTFKGAKLTTKVARGAKAGLMGAAIQEPVLAATQETRTWGEVGGNIAASAVFGMLLGGGAHVFDNSVRKEVADGTFYVPMDQTQRAEDAQSLSAAMARPVTEADMQVSAKAVEAVLNNTPGILGPTLRMMKSQALPVRRMAMDLLENFIPVDGVESGAIRQAAETDIKRTAESFEIAKERALRDGFKAYIDEIGGPSRWSPLQRLKVQREYAERVGRALRRDDFDPESATVSDVAKAIRNQVLDPFLKKSQSLGLIPEGYQTKTALSYFRRSWDQIQLSARQNEFIDIAANWFTQGMQSGAMRAETDAQIKLSEAEGRLQTATMDDGSGRPSQAVIDDMKGELADLRKERIVQRPVLDALSARGVDPQSTLADELRAMGVDNQSAPGLFVRGGAREVDNLDTLGDLDEVLARDGDYISRQDILDAIAEEMAGSPRRTGRQAEILRRIDEIEELIEKGGTGPGRAELRALEAEVQNLRAAAATAEADFANLTPDEMNFYAREAAQGVWNTLTGRDGGVESPIVSVVQGPLKGRTFMIPDELIEDFLVDDAHDVLTQYIRTMSAETVLKERFGRADLRDQIAEVQETYSGLKEGKSEKEAIELDKERELMVETIEATRDMLRGTYMAKENATPVAAASRSFRAFNFAAMLGDVVLSSVPDVLRVAQVHGLSNLIGPQGLKAITQSAKALKKAGHENWLRQEVELAGISEVFLKSRVAAMADLHDPYAGAGRVEQFTRALADVGGMASGVNHWNQFWKQVTWQHGVHRMNRIAKGEAKRGDKKWLRSLKVSSRDMDRIGAQLQKHGLDHEGMFDANSRAWDDPEAQRVFQNALRADADSVVVTPGVGDKPLFTAHPIGALAFQFKSFFAATHQRALMRGLGEDQTDFLTGAASMIAAGMAVYYLKSLSSNFELSDNPGVWIAEGIDRSGVLAVPMELNNMVEPMLNRVGAGGLYTGLSAAMGDSAELSSRYRFRRDFIGSTLLGPTAGTVTSAGRVGDALLGRVIGGQEFTEGDVGAAGRLVPFANHPGVKQFMRYFAIPELKESVR